MDVGALQRTAEVEGDVEALDLGGGHEIDHRIDPVGVAERERPALHLILVVVVDQGAAGIDA